MDKDTTTRVMESRGPRTLGPSVAQSAREMLDRMALPLDESATPSEGIYYVVRYHDLWKPFAYRFDEYPEEIDHSQMWEEFVCPILAQNWYRQIGMPPTRLERQLHLHAYGFPRGRVTRAPGKLKFNILYGGDVQPFMGTSNSTIERLFSVTNLSVWVPDSHERCQEDDRDAVRRILKLKEDWPAVDPNAEPD